jgi:putative ABC transport system permease protein
MGYLRLTRLLSLRPVQRRPLRTLLAVLAVAAGTSLAVSVFVVRTSTEQSVEDFGRSLAGPTELRVVGAIRRGGLEAGVVDLVAATDGVGTAVPVVQAVAIAAPADDGATTSANDDAVRSPSVADELPVLALGIDCRAEALAGPFGCTDELLAGHGDQPLARGPGIDPDYVLRTNLGTVGLEGVPAFEGLSALEDGRFVVFSLPTAQRLFNRDGRLDAVYVEPTAAADTSLMRSQLERVVGEHNGVLGADEAPPEITSALDNVLPLFSLLALFALGVGAMLVYNAVTLSVEERRRELAVVGALGASRRVVATTALAEAGLLGALGGVLGAAGGGLVAAPIVASLSTRTERIAGIPLDVHVGMGSLAVGAMLGLVVALVAAVPAVRRAMRVDVTAELSSRGLQAEASLPNRLGRVAVWALVTGLGLGLVWFGQRDGGLERWQYPATGLGFGLTALAMLLLIASLAAPLIRPLGSLLGHVAAGRLAVANLVRNPGRTGVMVVAVAAAVATAFVTASYIDGVRSAVSGGVGTHLDGVEVSSVGRGANINLDAGLPPATLAKLAELDGVAETRRGAVTLVGSRPGELVVVAAHQHSWSLRDGTQGIRGTIDLEGLERGEVVISASLARNHGLRPGDQMSLPTPGGMVELPVQAIVRGAGTGEGRVTMSYDRHVELFGPQPARTVTVVPTAGLSLEELRDRIQAADLGTDVRIRMPEAVADEVTASVEDQVQPLWTLQRGLLGVSFVAVLSTLLLVGVQRRQELAMLTAVGSAPTTLARMVLAEAGIVGLTAVGLGLAGGLVVLWALVASAPLLTGMAVPFHPSWAAILVWGGVALLVALLAALWPSHRAARTDVLVGLRYE